MGDNTSQQCCQRYTRHVVLMHWKGSAQLAVSCDRMIMEQSPRHQWTWATNPSQRPHLGWNDDVAHNKSESTTSRTFTTTRRDFLQNVLPGLLEEPPVVVRVRFGVIGRALWGRWLATNERNISIKVDGRRGPFYTASSVPGSNCNGLCLAGTLEGARLWSASQSYRRSCGETSSRCDVNAIMFSHVWMKHSTLPSAMNWRRHIRTPTATIRVMVRPYDGGVHFENQIHKTRCTRFLRVQTRNDIMGSVWENAFSLSLARTHAHTHTTCPRKFFHRLR
jgi:hypothetical protein